MKFEVQVSPQALLDIEAAISYYNSQWAGGGDRFYTAVLDGLLAIGNKPYFAIRYGETRCFQIRTFPYMIHYRVLEQLARVEVHAVISTHRDPAIWPATA